MNQTNHEQHEVEKVVGWRFVVSNDRQKILGYEVLIKWTGWDLKHNTWEPVKHLDKPIPDFIEWCVLGDAAKHATRRDGVDGCGCIK